MFRVSVPELINETFACAFNSRDINNLLALYERDAILRTTSASDYCGMEEIRKELQNLLQVPGVMQSINNFCIVSGDIALLRADYSIQDAGKVHIAGSS